MAAASARAQTGPPDNSSLAVQLNRQGIALAKKGEPAAAIEDFRKAIELSPDYPDASFNLAVALQNTGQLKEAIKFFRVAARLRPDSSLIHLTLGLALIQNEDLAGAQTELADAAKLDPRDEKAHYNLGLVLEQEGNRRLRPASFARPFARTPNSDRRTSGLGLSCDGLAFRTKLFPNRRRRYAFCPKDPEAHYRLALILRSRGNQDQAFRELEYRRYNSNRISSGLSITAP